MFNKLLTYLLIYLLASPGGVVSLAEFVNNNNDDDDNYYYYYYCVCMAWPLCGSGGLE